MAALKGLMAGAAGRQQTIATPVWSWHLASTANLLAHIVQVLQHTMYTEIQTVFSAVET